MDAWESDEFDSLVNGTISVAQEKMGQMRNGDNDSHWAKVATRLIFEDELFSAV